MLCDDEGALKAGDHWYTWRDISRDFNTRIRTAHRIGEKLVDVGLLACGKPVENLLITCGNHAGRDPIVVQLSDNCPHFVVLNADKLQQVYVRKPRKEAPLDPAYRELNDTEVDVDVEEETKTAVGLRPLLLLDETA